MGLQTYHATEKEVKKSVYYEGTDKLKEGMALCYNHDSNAGATTTSEDFNRVWRVEKPATANLPAFAGLVAKGHGGKTGPCMIEIELPTGYHRGVIAHTDQNCTILTTKLAVVGSTYALGAVGDANKTVAEALQTINRSSTAGPCLVKFGGFPSVTAYTLTAPALTGGTTGESTGVVGATAGAPDDILRLFDFATKARADISAIQNRLERAGVLDV